MKQQDTTLLPFNGIKGGRKTSCMACQQKNSYKKSPNEEKTHRLLVAIVFIMGNKLLLPCTLIKMHDCFAT